MPHGAAQVTLNWKETESTKAKQWNQRERDHSTALGLRVSTDIGRLAAVKQRTEDSACSENPPGGNKSTQFL